MTTAPRAPRLVVGLDGGGTKTVAVAVDAATLLPPTPSAAAQIPLLGRAQGGSTNWNSVGVEAAHANWQDVIRQAVAAAGGGLADVAAICIGMSGVDRPHDRAQVQQWLDDLLPGVPAQIVNDAVIALAAGTAGELLGVVLISGTGMIALGYNRAGERVRAGGWGALLGDGGSGYALGAAILRAATWAADGRGPETALLPAVLEFLHLEQPDQLVRWAYDDIAWARFAQLAPLASVCAARGDAAAQAILDQGAADLAVAVEIVARRLGLAATAFPLVTAGNNLRPGRLLSSLRQRLQTSLPHAYIVQPPVDPVVGAALLALRAQT
jgi:N-acetylglucosamine kinase-like BadF-type ATPase